MKKGEYNYCFTVMGFKNLVSIFLLFFLISCGNQEKKDVGILLQAWSGKEIQFPEDLTFTVKGADTVAFPQGHSEKHLFRCPFSLPQHLAIKVARFLGLTTLYIRNLLYHCDRKLFINQPWKKKIGSSY